MTWRDPIRRLGWLVLTVSFGLRACLAYRGGQLFWPDEDRFELARQIARALQAGQIGPAADLLFGHPDHFLFKVAALLPAGLETVAGTPGWVSALFFAATSTWTLWLVARAARAAGGSEREALVALTLAACTTSLFYFSRHLFPYDLSLGLFLLSLIAGLRGHSFRAGLWAGLGYLAYNGYWSLGAALLTVHVLRALPQPMAMFTRGAYALAGLVAPLLIVAAISRPAGHDFIAQSMDFAGTVYQGDLGRAWLVVPQYLWASEHGLAVLWVVTLALSLILIGQPGEQGRQLWPTITVLTGLLLIIPSDLLHHFAISARHVRVLTPFLCLTAASVLCSPALFRARPGLLAGLLGLVGLQAAFNFAAPLAQVFPREFTTLAARYLATARRHDLGPYTIINATFLHNPDWVPTGPDAGTVGLQRNHPFQFTPYLYEGYDAATRARYQKRDLSMRVVRLDAGGPPFAGYPDGMIELTLRFPANPPALFPEPILATGQPGKGDLIYVRYEDREHIRFGHDHMGGSGELGDLLSLDRSKPHRVRIGLGPLFTPGTTARASSLFVLWDDTVALFGAAELHPSAADEIDIAHDFIGASTAVPQLSAAITGFARLPLPPLGAAFVQPPGALRLEFLLPPSPAAVYAQPLLSSGRPEQGDLLFLRSEGAGRFRLGHDNWGGGAELSEPFTLDPSRPQELIVALGPFFPAGESASVAGLKQRRLYVSSNGRIIFNRVTTFHSSTVTELQLGENHTASTIVSPSRLIEILRCESIPPGPAWPAPEQPPGAIRLALRFFAIPAPGQSEPILTTGRTGAGDLLFIRFDDEGHFRIGHDHWGHALVLSEPQPFDRTRPLELTIALGSLFPPPAVTTDPAVDPLVSLRNRLYVAVGDRIILSQPDRFHGAAAAPWALGLNAIGANTAREMLSADVIDFSSIPAETLLPLLSPR